MRMLLWLRLRLPGSRTLSRPPIRYGLLVLSRTLRLRTLLLLRLSVRLRLIRS